MALEKKEFEYIKIWAKEHAAADLVEGKQYLVESRLCPIASKYGLSGIGGLIEKLKVEKGGAIYDDVIDAITTHETSFFRDAHPFKYMQKTLFPELMKMRLGAKRIGIWSAACSSGQEIYSTAMIIRENFPNLKEWDVELLATDISQPVINKAQKGEFTQMEISRGLPANMRDKYFTKTGTNIWTINEDIRNMVKFQPLNLIKPWPGYTPFQIIFMRNVLIYFDTEEKKRILDRLKVYLKRNGVLMLGSSETTLNLDDDWEICHVDGTTFYRLVGF